jgi:hypothetical protein
VFTTCAVIAGVAMIAGAVFVVRQCGTLLGGVCMGGFKMMGDGLEIILTAIAKAND